MPFMKRLNRVMRVQDSEVAMYRANGYTLLEDVAEPTVDKPTQPPIKAPLEKLSVGQLRDFAADKGIEIPPQVTRRETILKRIRESQNEAE